MPVYVFATYDASNGGRRKIFNIILVKYNASVIHYNSVNIIKRQNSQKKNL